MTSFLAELWFALQLVESINVRAKQRFTTRVTHASNFKTDKLPDGPRCALYPPPRPITKTCGPRCALYPLSLSVLRFMGI